MEFNSTETLFFFAWILATLSFIFKIILEVYIYILAIIVLYILHKILAKKYVNKIEITGQGILITGCDTGLGHDAALRLTKIGFTVFAGCLKPDGEGANVLREKGGERLHVVPLDVTSDESVDHALDIVKRNIPDSGLWAVINNAGIEFIADIEFTRIEMMKRVAEVNLYGIVRVTKACLPLIRKSRGRVINVTSVKGRLPLPIDSAYIVTKWAGEAFSDILRREMYRFGVNVVIVEPGHFGGVTEMLMNKNRILAEDDLNEAWNVASADVKAAYGREYIDSLINGLSDVATDGCSSTDPVSNAMQDAVESANPKCRYLVHGTKRPVDKYCVLAVLNQVLPEAVSDYLIRLVFPLPHAAQQIT